MAVPRSIDHLLDSYSHDALLDIADAVNIAPRQKQKMRKADITALLKEKLFTSARVLASYALLSEEDRRVLNYLLFRGGEVDKTRLERDLVRARMVTPIEKNRVRHMDHALYAPEERMANTLDQSRALQDVLARLTLQGLVFTTPSIYDDGGYNYKLGVHPARYVFVPANVKKFLPTVTTSPIASAEWTPARTAHQTPHVLLRELFLYWDFVWRTEPPILRAGVVGKRTLRTINELMIEPDPKVETAQDENGSVKLKLLRTVLMKLDLIEVRGLKIVAKPGASGGLPKFWTVDLPQQLVALLKALLPQKPPATSSSYQYEWEIDLYKGQRALLEALLHMDSKWCDIAMLADAARQKDRGFLVPDFIELKTTRYIQVYFMGHYFSDIGPLADAIEKVEDATALELCSALLLPLGLIEVGFLQGNDREWRLIRLTPVGRSIVETVLGAKPEAATSQVAERGAAYDAAVAGIAPTQSDEGRVIVQPNFQVLAIGPVRTSILARLQLCAVRTKSDAHVFEYSLTRDSIYQAQQADFPVDAVIEFLQETSGALLPQNVLRSLQEWGAHHDRIVFRTNVNLLQAVDADMLNRLLSDPTVGAHLARSIAPAVALIADGAQDALVDALYRQGALPASADADPSRTDNDVIVQPDGALTPVHAVPNLFLTGRLARIAEQDQQGVWRLTPATVRWRGHGREAMQAILNELGRLHRGALPDSVVADVKRWGGYYGQVAIATITLLEFESKAHLADARTHPALQKLLTPFVAGDRALAVIQTEQIAEAQRILAELGVTISHVLDAAP
ncbi:MAG: helicase-associated domain-containing protein [Caldilinea sp.]